MPQETRHWLKARREREETADNPEQSRAPGRVGDACEVDSGRRRATPGMFCYPDSESSRPSAKNKQTRQRDRRTGPGGSRRIQSALGKGKPPSPKQRWSLCEEGKQTC